MTEYREGCDMEKEESVTEMEAPVAVEDEEPVAQMEAPNVKPEVEGSDPENVPVTAFMVIQYKDGRVEAASKLEEFEMDRQANLPTIRDLCHTLYSNIQATIIARASAENAMLGIQRGMAQQQIQQMQQQIIKPGK